MEFLTIFFVQHPFLAWTALGLFGLCVGSFLNVVIYRTPLMLKHAWREECTLMLEEPEVELPKRFNLLLPASHCPGCKTPIKPFSNIPVLSYLLQKGRCKQCDCPISFRYPFVELLCGFLIVCAVMKFGCTLAGFGAMIVVAISIALTFIDFDHQLLPDNLTLGGLWLGLIFNLNFLFTDIHSAVLGAFFGYLSLWSVFWVFKLITGKDGMGFGDFKLVAMYGAWLGWQQLPVVILLSSLIGAVVGLSMIAFMGHDRQVPIPFGPYIVAAGLASLFFGPEILDWYLGYYR